MKYISTRDSSHSRTAAQAILEGIAPDGGLYLPQEIPALSREMLEELCPLTYQERAARILGMFLTDYTKEELEQCVKGAYDEGFDEGRPAPLSTLCLLYTSFTVPSCYGYFSTNRFYHFMSLEEVRSNSSFTSIPQQRYDRIIKEQEFEVESSEIIKNNNGVPQWIIITENSKKHKLAVVILPPDTLCKDSHPEPVKGFSTVAIDLINKRDFNSLKSMDLKKMLIQQIEYKRWLSSPKITKWCEQQQAEQHKWYEKYCEKQAEKLSAPMVKCNENAVHEKSAVSVVFEEQGIYPPICAVIQDHCMKKEELLEFPSVYKDNMELLALQSYFSKKYNDVPTDAAVKDIYGRRWYFCNRCNQWYLAKDMAIRGEGAYRNGKRERPNEGVCTFCSRKKPI